MISTMLMLAVGLQASSPNPMDSALIDGDKVHIFLPQVLVSEGRLLASGWSSDGMYLLVLSEKIDIAPKEYKEGWEGKKLTPRDVDVEVHVFSMRSGTSKRLYHRKRPFGSEGFIRFLEGSDTAVVSIGDARGTGSEILRVVSGTSKVEIIEKASDFIDVGFGPKNDLVSLHVRGGWVRFIGTDGKLYTKQPTPQGAIVVWSTQSEPLLIIGDGGVFAINPSGGFEPTNGRPSTPYLIKAPETRIQASSPPLGVDGVPARLNTILASVIQTQRSIVVAVEATNPEVSPTSSGIFFMSNGLNLVRPIVEISKTTFDEVLAKAARNLAMQKAAQIGKALIMYSGDNDDAFPTAEEFANGALDGYLGDKSILNGFAYTGTSDDLGPAATQVGYLLCPGGRAVLFQDGHVVFEPDR